MQNTNYRLHSPRRNLIWKELAARVTTEYLEWREYVSWQQLRHHGIVTGNWNVRHIEVPLAKSGVFFDRDHVSVCGYVVGAAGDNRLRPQRKLHAIQDLFLGARTNKRPLDVDRIKNLQIAHPPSAPNGATALSRGARSHAASSLFRWTIAFSTGDLRNATRA